MEKNHNLFKKKIMKDLKQLINIYDFLLEELAYDNQNNLLKIISIPVTFSSFYTLMVPLVPAAMKMM